MPFLYVDFNQVKSIIKKKTLEQINHAILFPRVQKQLLVTTSMHNLKKKRRKKNQKRQQQNNHHSKKDGISKTRIMH